MLTRAFPVLLVALFVGCANIGRPSVSPDPTIEPITTPSASAQLTATPDDTSGPSDAPTAASTTAISTPAPTLERTSEPTLTAEPTAEASPASVLAASDLFWEEWYDTCFFGATHAHVDASLAEITTRSSLVIRGRISDAFSEWIEGDAYDSYVTVSIAEVFKGRLKSGVAEVDVRISWMSSDIEDLQAALPAHDHIWFLIAQQDPETTYDTTNYLQVSVLRDIDGKVRVIKPDWIAGALGPGHYPVPLDGTSFEKLRELVRELSGSTTPLARISPPSQPSPHGFAAC